MNEENIPLEQMESRAPFKIGGYVLVLMSLLILFIFLPALLIIVFVGMMPTMGAAISDPSTNRSQTMCVGFCNLSGLIPAFHQIYGDHFILSSAYNIIHNEFNLLYILGVSALGWGLFFIVPSITVSIYRTRDKLYLIRMMKRYKELKEIWGDALPDSEILAHSKGGIKYEEGENKKDVA